MMNIIVIVHRTHSRAYSPISQDTPFSINNPLDNILNTGTQVYPAQFLPSI